MVEGYVYIDVFEIVDFGSGHMYLIRFCFRHGSRLFGVCALYITFRHASKYLNIHLPRLKNTGSLASPMYEMQGSARGG